MEINFDENSSASFGRTNHPDDIANFKSFKTFDDFLAEKDSPLVYCTLVMEGKEFLRKSSLEVQFHQKTADHDEFTLIIPDDALDTFEGYILEKSKYVIGKTVTIRLHRFGEIRQTFTGIITKLINKKENSYGDLHIIGYAPTILMEHGLECQSFEDKSLSQIVKEISQEYPSELVIDTDYLNHYNKENNLPYTVQYKETDYQFLQRLAKRHGEFLYYNGEKVMMGSKTEKSKLLEDGRDLINVEIELNTKPQHFQYKTYDAISGSVLQSDSQNESNLFSKNNPFQDRAYNASNQIFRKKPKSFHSQTSLDHTSRDLQNSIKKEKENRQNLVVVRGSSRDPEIRQGCLIELKDINNHAMETYRIIEIKHFHSGYDYHNEFVAINDTIIPPYYDENAFPLCEEQYARVIDNNDPKGIGRVRVQFAWQEDKNAVSPWLRLIQPHSGAGKGFYFVPEIGEEVLVGFESMNAETPYVLGTQYNGAETSGFHTKGNSLKVIQTRSGCKIVINDEKGSMLLQDANGSQVFLDGQGNIDLMSSKKINLDSKEINLRAEKIKLESSEIMDIKSYQSAKFTSFQTMNIDSTKSLKVNSTNMSMNAKENFKTTAQKVDLGAEKQMKVSSQAMEVHGTDTMDLKSPTLNKVTQAEKVSASTGDEKGVQAIALIIPSKSYKGEFGIDFCEMDDKFEKIIKFQGTNISDIEYIFDKATNQYKKVATGDSAEKQSLIKEMYYSKTYFGKTYLATWMNVKEGVTAKVNLTTFFIDKSKKPDTEKEFISFKENPNFEITYDGQKNNAIKIKVKEHKKEYKDIEIKAIKSFETIEYIDIVDEEENVVGIIEMSPNKVEELEIKIIPVVFKTLTPAIQDTQAEATYNKAMAAKNADGKNLTDTLTQYSLNQAGIKGKLVANPKGAEKIIIDVTNEYKNYWDVTKKELKDWTFNATETDPTKRPPVWKSEDGQNIYEFKNGKVDNDTRMLLDELEEDYYKKYGRSFKGAIIFVIDEKYNKPNVNGYSQNNPLRSQGTIIFTGGLGDTDTYTHELGHMLGLEHTFFSDVKDFNETNSGLKNNEDNIKIHQENIKIITENYRPAIEGREKQIQNSEESIKEYEKQMSETKLKNIKEERAKWIEEEKENIEKKKKEKQDKIDARDKEIEEEQRKINDEKEKLKINISHQFRTVKSKTVNFMDYDIKRLYFSKYQCKTMYNETKKYY